MTFRPLAVFLVLAASPGLFAASQAAIAVSATAAQAYVRPVDDKGAPLPETYLFAEGQYFAGGTVDRGLSKTSFTDITRTMAANLAKQNYFPTSDRDGADLIIMVHWGATLTYEDPQREFNIEGLQAAAAAYNSAASSGNIVDTNELNYQLGLQEDARESTQQAIERNAILLGFKSSLEKERRAHLPTTAEITMSNELNEERYFVVLMAYDYQVLKKEKKSNLLWVTRLSVRSPGNNFVESLPTLGRAGSEVFGQHIDGLARVRTPWQRGRVDLGELQVVGPAETTEPTGSKKK